MAAKSVRPPEEGLAEPVLVVQPPLGDVWKLTLLLTAVFLAYLVLRDALDHVPLLPSAELVLECAVGALLVALLVHRGRTSMGPGWLAHRGLVSTAWVRTDRLTRVTHRHSASGGALTLHDEAGRRLDLPVRRLHEHTRVRAQLVADARARAAQVDLDGSSRELLLGSGRTTGRPERR